LLKSISSSMPVHTVANLRSSHTRRALFSMHHTALLVASLLSLGCGRRVHSPWARSDKQVSLAPLKLLTKVAPSNPTTAFNPISAGGRFARGYASLATSSIPLMSTLSDDSKLADQELRESLEARIEQLTIEHPDILDIKDELACALKDSGDLLKGAEEMLRENIDVITKSQGFDAPGVLMAKDRLAEVLRGLGHDKSAEELEEEVQQLRSHSVEFGKRGERYWEKVSRYSKQIALIKKKLADSHIIFCMPLAGLTANQIQDLKNRLPESTVCSAVKNKFLKHAVGDFPQFGAIDPLLACPRLWFFCTEDSFKPTLQAIEEWQAENQKAETHPILGGGMDGVLYDQDGIIAASKLPGRLELMQRLAIRIKNLPTKIARSVSPVPTKFARGLRLASQTDNIARGVKAAAEKLRSEDFSVLGSQ